MTSVRNVGAILVGIAVLLYMPEMLLISAGSPPHLLETILSGALLVGYLGFAFTGVWQIAILWFFEIRDKFVFAVAGITVALLAALAALPLAWLGFEMIANAGNPTYPSPTPALQRWHDAVGNLSLYFYSAPGYAFSDFFRDAAFLADRGHGYAMPILVLVLVPSVVVGRIVGKGLELVLNRLRAERLGAR